MQIDPLRIERVEHVGPMIGTESRPGYGMRFYLSDGRRLVTFIPAAELIRYNVIPDPMKRARLRADHYDFWMLREARAKLPAWTVDEFVRRREAETGVPWDDPGTVWRPEVKRRSV